MNMPSKDTQPRRISRRSVRTSAHADHLLTHSSSESLNEQASDDSGSAYKPTSSSTSDESVTSLASSDGPKTTGSDSASGHSVSKKRMTRSRMKVRPQSLPRVARINGPDLKGDIESTGPGQIKQLSSSSALYKYLVGCRLKALTSVKTISINCFSQSVESLQSIFQHAVHPFAFHDGIVFKDEFNARQAVLFPTNVSWQPYSHTDELGCLPEPFLSPLLTSNEQDQHGADSIRLRRFEFNKEHRLIYVGGFVKCVAWCPTRMHTDNIGIEKKDSMYLAVSTYPSPATRFTYPDPPQTHSGLIQIWNCGELSLSGPPQIWQPEPHLLIAHQWGYVTDMCWLPLSVTLVARMPKTLIGKLVCSNSQLSPSPLIHRTLGHLIIACQDGLVRVIAIPRLQMDPIYFQLRRGMPLYKLNPKVIMKLSPSAAKAVDWIGWPTCLHIRSQFPNRLFVGYSRGHVAYYDLSCVHPLLFTASECHLTPIRLFQLVNGPVRSMSLNALNGRMLIVHGLDSGIRVWDLEDTASSTTEGPEMCWLMAHGVPGKSILWHSQGDTVFLSRECIARRQFTPNKKCKKLNKLPDPVTVSDNALYQTMWEAPSDDTRILVPLDLQSVSHIDFSEPLNAVLCTTDRGRIEVTALSLDGRHTSAVKCRYLGQTRFPLCQWILDPSPHTKSDSESVKSYSDIFPKSFSSKSHILSFSSTLAPSCTQNVSDFTDPDCSDCHSDRSFCWHKLWTHHKLTILTKKKVPSKPYVDFQKTPLLNIPQAAFCPCPQAATWIAAGTACGFVHFLHADFLYLKEFSRLLNQPPGEFDSPYLNTETTPHFRSTCNVGYSAHRPSRSTSAFTAKGHASRTKFPTSNGHDTADKLDRLLHQKLHVSSASDSENPVESSSQDSDATEAMSYGEEMCTTKCINQQNGKRSSRRSVVKMNVADDSDHTDPCCD